MYLFVHFFCRCLINSLALQKEFGGFEDEELLIVKGKYYNRPLILFLFYLFLSIYPIVSVYQSVFLSIVNLYGTIN